MNLLRHRFLLLLTLLGASGLRHGLVAQQTTEDSAQVLLDASRVLQRKGETTLARNLLEVLRNRWPGTAAAQEVASRLTALPDTPVSGFARTSFIAYHTALGAYLGLAIPAALSVSGDGPYGAGLLLGAPAGFIGSRSYARTHALTDGQANLISFASEFGIWQAVGWRTQLGIGEHTECFGDYCYNENHSETAFTASIIGAAGGMLVGVLASRPGIASGTSTMISHSGYWGTWFGFAVATLADHDNGGHGALSSALIGSDIGVLLAIPAAGRWHPSSARVALISAGGIAGGLAGLGVTLLADVDDEKGALGIVLAGNVAGMVAAAALTRDQPGNRPASGMSPALLSLGEQTRWGIPMPLPTVLSLRRPVGGKDRVPGMKLGLLHAEF